MLYGTGAFQNFLLMPTVYMNPPSAELFPTDEDEVKLTVYNYFSIAEFQENVLKKKDKEKKH